MQQSRSAAGQFWTSHGALALQVPHGGTGPLGPGGELSRDRASLVVPHSCVIFIMYNFLGPGEPDFTGDKPHVL